MSESDSAARLTRSWRAATADDMRVLAARFAQAFAALPRHAHPSNRAWRVALQGDLGAGKTTWVQGFAAALGVSAAVTSPSYALLQSYESPTHTLVHADFYRLTDPSELDALALDTFDRAQYVWLIEWPERADARIDVWDLRLNLVIETGAHLLDAAALNSSARQWLSTVLD